MYFINSSELEKRDGTRPMQWSLQGVIETVVHRRHYFEFEVYIESGTGVASTVRHLASRVIAFRLGARAERKVVAEQALKRLVYDHDQVREPPCLQNNHWRLLYPHSGLLILSLGYMYRKSEFSKGFPSETVHSCKGSGECLLFMSSCVPVNDCNQIVQSRCMLLSWLMPL
jgi:hypothetical protein